MPRLGSESLQTQSVREIQIPLPIKDVTQRIGLEPLSAEEVEARFGTMSHQLAIGLARNGRPTMKDGGLLAIRTHIPRISTQVWDQVPVGLSVLVSEFGGTNLNISRATKEDSGISLGVNLFTRSFTQDERQVSFATYISNLVDPLRNLSHTDENFGLSLGFPHIGEQTPYGMEATPDTQDGTLSNQWHITNWNNISPQERGIVQAVRKQLGEQQNEISGIGINDTPGVALDSGAAKIARHRGYEVLPVGIVAGTGSNGALDLGEGLVNTEIGQGDWPDDSIAKRMRQRLIDKGALTPDQDHPKFEHESGEYLPLRLAAGIDLLGEMNLVTEGKTLAGKIEALASKKENAGLISDLATGAKWISTNHETNTIIQGLAQATLKRAEQVYGIFLATIAKPVLLLKETDKPAALLTEGSTIHKGHGLKVGAEKVAGELLDEPITIVPAKGMNGVAALAMSWSLLKAI